MVTRIYYKEKDVFCAVGDTIKTKESILVHNKISARQKRKKQQT